MKKIFVLSFLLFCSFVSAQEKKSAIYNEDYFQLGILGGEYQNYASWFHEPSYIPNALGLELEYFKSTNISFFVKGIYQNTYNDIKKMFYLSSEAVVLQEPTIYRFILSFGGKYYTSLKSPQLYFELGLAHENLTFGSYSYKDYFSENSYMIASSDAFQYNQLYIDTGVGLKIKLSSKLNLDMQYGLGLNLEKERKTLSTNSILAGLKINL